MPRGKFTNHKGRSRQFTPVEELQREMEENLNLGPNGYNYDIKEEIYEEQRSFDEDSTYVRGRKIAGAVAGLIEISNPNRPAKNSIGMLKHLGERTKEKFRLSNKTPSEANADLARLAIVRKQREAAAELRLAAKKESQNLALSMPITAKSDISLKKKNNKFKSAGLGYNNFLKSCAAGNSVAKDNNNTKSKEIII